MSSDMHNSQFVRTNPLTVYSTSLFFVDHPDDQPGYYGLTLQCLNTFQPLQLVSHTYRLDTEHMEKLTMLLHINGFS